MAVFVPLVHFQNHFLPKISFSLIRSDSSHEIVELSLIEHSVWTCQLYLFAIVDIIFFLFHALSFDDFICYRGWVSAFWYFSAFLPQCYLWGITNPICIAFLLNCMSFDDTATYSLSFWSSIWALPVKTKGCIPLPNLYSICYCRSEKNAADLALH